MKVDYSVENDAPYPSDKYVCIDVEFEGYPVWDNDSFSYAGTHCTGGVSGTVKMANYATMKDSEITWNFSRHTGDENELINSWLSVEENYGRIEEMFCDKLVKDSKDY